MNSANVQTSGATYDVGGNVLTSANADGNSTTYTYNEGSGYDAFPITVTNALQQVSGLAWDYGAGKLIGFLDAAGNKTNYAYADYFDRITQISEPTGASTGIYYIQRILTIVLHTQSTSPAVSTHSEVAADGFGRDIEDRQYTDFSQHLIAIERAYDAMGRIAYTYNPTLITINGWTGDGLNYSTQYSYDSLSRLIKVAYPDGNATTTSYSGNATTVTDASSNATKTLSDALGRVTTVYEDPGTGTHLNLQTQYTYDALGDLTYVSKCPSTGCGSNQQNRSFTFDMLGRLTQAVNPESGTYSYSYTNSTAGNQLALQSRTDPRGFTTTYIRDALDRVTGINYNDGTPNATYTYSNIGNLTQSSNSNVTNNYTTFDKDGRVTASNVQIGSLTYSFSYQYDLAGDLIQETYPSGRTVNTTYDLAMRPTPVNGVSGGTATNYVQQAGYYPHGAVQYWAYGNNLWSWQTFTKLLRPYQGWATQGNNGNNWMFYAGNSFNPNETVQQQQEGYSQAGTPGVPWNSLSTLQAQFGYDSLNRLNSVTDTGYSRGYHYDEFGNLSVQSNTNVPLSSVTPFYNGSANPYNALTNHIVTVDANNGYDGRGNITKLAVNTVTMGYDAESNMTSTVDTGTGQNISWVYDAEGQRAQKLISGGSWTLYIHDAFGQLAASYNNNGVTPACTTCYLTYDMVGTPRLITDQNENVVARHDFIPFGEEIQNGVAERNGNFGSASNVTQAFTGQESDGGTVQLDYFNARHLSAVLGGFVQPDPMNAGADITRPQSWNAYGYVLGNPLEYTDPSGACDVLINGLDQHPGWAPIDYFARNMISAFPFDDHGIVGGLDQLLYGDGGQPTAYQALKLALAQTPAGESVNVFAISGGSRAFASAFDMLSGPEQGRIGNVTYMIPGGFGALPSGNGSTTVINGKGLVNSFINHGNPVRRYSVVSAAKCDHDPACIVESAYLPTLVQTEGTSCSSPATVVPGSKGTATSIIRYGGGGGTSSGSGGQWIYIYPTQGENGDSTTPGNWVFFPGSGPPRPPSNQ